MKETFEMNLQLFAQPESLTAPRSNLPNAISDQIRAREVDFVTRFDDDWKALTELLGIMRPIRKTPGTRLVSYKATVDELTPQATPGALIPFSKAKVDPVAYADLELELYGEGTTIQDVEKYGAAIAIEKIDEAFLSALQTKVLVKFYDFIKTGALTGTAPTWQAALAKAQGMVLNKFMGIQKKVSEVIGFANVQDAYEYLGNTQISTQTAFGLTYLQNFLGYRTLFLLPDRFMPRGKVYAVPVDNIDLYYSDPADGDFQRLGLTYTVKGDTNLIGFHAEGNYSTAVGETYAIMGMVLWAEYLDGIANVTINASPFQPLTIAGANPATSYWGHTPSEFQADDISVANHVISGTLYDFDGWDSGTLKGEGHFIALKFSGLDSSATGAKVGLVPSASGMDLQTLDADMDAVFKIDDRYRQYLVTQVFDDAGNFSIETYSLSGLKFEPAPEA